MQASIDFDGTLIGSIAGGGGGGSEVTITPVITEGTKIADYSIDGNEGAIYTPEIEISKNVLSGVKICEIEGVEIFAPSYGYIDTLGDSNVEQSGGFSQGANVTPVNVKRVSYTNDVSNGEKIGSLTVGDTSYNVYQKASSNIIVNNNEKIIGTWFDETLYEKTIVIHNESIVNRNMTITTIDSTFRVKNWKAFAIDSGINYPIPYVGGSANASLYFCNDGRVEFTTTNATFGAGSDFYITIQYTKEVT